VSEPLLEIVDLSKRFGGLSALEQVSLQIDSGEVVGIVGRRGAGKSTLLNLLGGTYPPSAGEIIFDGRPVHLQNPQQAHRLGIRFTHQEPLLLENLNVLQNLTLGQEQGWPIDGLLPDETRMIEGASRVLSALDTPASLLHARISSLSDEQRQIVAIARALYQPGRLLLLDDALDALSFQRQEKMLEVIRNLSAQGVALLIASDNLKHLFAVTHRILVLYEGRVIADRDTSDCTPRNIVELIVGSTRQEQVTPIIWALESYHAAQQQAEELHHAQASLRQSLEAQDSLNQQLLERLRDQVEALDQLNLALQATQRRLMTEREQERKYLARELHDQVIQDLLSFNYRLEEAEDEPGSKAQRKELTEIRSGIRQVVADLRQLCSDLRPPTIDSHGLSAAIRSFAQEWAEKSNIELELQIDPRLGRLPEAIELSVFRIVQEGLNNISKHARAKHVQLHLQRTPTASLKMRLTDDGTGLGTPIDLAALSAAKHFGLLGISERVALLGGTMQIDSPDDQGTTLQVEIPSPYPSVQDTLS
jgi:signal transduction histidine kinase